VQAAVSPASITAAQCQHRLPLPPPLRLRVLILGASSCCVLQNVMCVCVLWSTLLNSQQELTSLVRPMLYVGGEGAGRPTTGCRALACGFGD
jgi:hypothetical protein